MILLREILRLKAVQNRIARRIDRFTNLIGKLAYWLVLVMIGVGVWNVLGRYIGNAIGQNLSSPSGNPM